MQDPATPAPSTVRLAARLFIVGGALDGANALLTLVMLPVAIAAITGGLRPAVAGPVLDAMNQRDAVAIGFYVAGALLALGFAVVTVLLARLLLRGRNWARVVLLVLAVLALPGLLPADASGMPVLPFVLATLLTVASVVLQLVAAVLTFLPRSAPWFRRPVPASMEPAAAPR